MHFTDFLTRFALRHLYAFYLLQWYLNSLSSLPNLTTLMRRYGSYFFPSEGGAFVTLYNTVHSFATGQWFATFRVRIDALQGYEFANG
jgi:hypothetical protein